MNEFGWRIELLIFGGGEKRSRLVYFLDEDLREDRAIHVLGLLRRDLLVIRLCIRRQDFMWRRSSRVRGALRGRMRSGIDLAGLDEDRVNRRDEDEGAYQNHAPREDGALEQLTGEGGPWGPAFPLFLLFFGDGACTGTPFSIDHPPFLLRSHLFLIRDAEPRPCHRGDVPDALAG